MSYDPGPTLSRRQQATLCALIDAFLPPLPEPSPHSHTPEAASLSPPRKSQRNAVSQYWTHRLSADPDFLRHVSRRLSRRQCRSLSLLSTVAGTAWATHCRNRGYGLADWPVTELPRLVHDAMYKNTRGRRQVRLWQSWKCFLCGSAYLYVTEQRRTGTRSQHVPGGSMDHDEESFMHNPFAWDALEYPGPRVVDRARDAQAVTQGLHKLDGLMVTESSSSLCDDKDECDVIVVGSGAGGAMAARTLSEAGFDVVVMEQASANHLQPDRLLEVDNSYARPVDYDTDVLIMTGHVANTLGGASRHGWGHCQTLPEHVRQEWVKDFGLDDVAPSRNESEYDQSLAIVLDEIRTFAAKDEFPLPTLPDTHNPLNSFLKRGCDILGCKYEDSGLCLREMGVAGMTGLGDRYMGAKRTALHDLAKSPNVRILTGARVEKVKMKRIGGSVLPRATGVEYVSSTTGDKRTLKARKCVVVAAGALESPCLLRRSGLRNHHIGQHLRLHPAATVFGFVSNSGLQSFTGAPTSILCTEFQTFKGGYGSMIQPLVPHPGLVAILLPWITPQRFRQRMVRLKYMVPLLCMQRDTSEGSVTQKRDGTLNVDYKLNKKDSTSIMESLQMALYLQVAGGATELSTSSSQDAGISLPLNNSSVQLLHGYLRSLEKLKVHESDLNLVSMHQMGSCRMSKYPRRGAVDPNGEVWECIRLYVMDSSILPTSIGVHPMLTIMVLARMLSLRLASKLRNADTESSGQSITPKQKGRYHVKRQLYAIELHIKTFVQMVVRLLVALLMLIPGFLFWWYDLGCLLA